MKHTFAILLILALSLVDCSLRRGKNVTFNKKKNTEHEFEKGSAPGGENPSEIGGEDFPISAMKFTKAKDARKKSSYKKMYTSKLHRKENIKELMKKIKDLGDPVEYDDFEEKLAKHYHAALHAFYTVAASKAKTRKERELFQNKREEAEKNIQ